MVQHFEREHTRFESFSDNFAGVCFVPKKLIQSSSSVCRRAPVIHKKSKEFVPRRNGCNFNLQVNGEPVAGHSRPDLKPLMPPAKQFLLRPPPPPTQPFALQPNRLGLPLPPLSLLDPIKGLLPHQWPLRSPPKVCRAIPSVQQLTFSKNESFAQQPNLQSPRLQKNRTRWN